MCGLPLVAGRGFGWLPIFWVDDARGVRTEVARVALIVLVNRDASCDSVQTNHAIDGKKSSDHKISIYIFTFFSLTLKLVRLCAICTCYSRSCLKWRFTRTRHPHYRYRANPKSHHITHTHTKLVYCIGFEFGRVRTRVWRSIGISSALD